MKFLIPLIAVELFAWGVPLLAAGDPQAGKAIYEKSCKGCHGAKGEGNPAVEKVMDVKFRHLGSRQVQAKSDEQLVKDATKGTDNRPKRTPNITDQQVQDVVAFVRTLKPN